MSKFKLINITIHHGFDKKRQKNTERHFFESFLHLSEICVNKYQEISLGFFYTEESTLGYLIAM